MAASRRKPPGRWGLFVEPRELPVWWWFVIAAALIGTDYLSGPYVQFAAAFIIPVFLAAWYSGLAPALVLAFVLPVARVALGVTVWNEPPDVGAAAGTAVILMAVFAGQAVLVARLARHERSLTRDVELLSGLLPICMHCKSIRDGEGNWLPLEQYFSTRTDTSFTHGVCQSCLESHYPEHAEHYRVPAGSGEPPDAAGSPARPSGQPRHGDPGT